MFLPEVPRPLSTLCSATGQAAYLEDIPTALNGAYLTIGIGMERGKQHLAWVLGSLHLNIMGILPYRKKIEK